MQHKDPQLMEKIRLYAMNYYREHNQMPSIRTIADGTGMNRGSVQKYLVEMQERGIIEYDGKIRHIHASKAPMHARRPFAQSFALAGAGSMTEEEKAALPEYRPLQLLGQIFAIETELKNLSADERKERRTVEVRPLMDEYFNVIHSLDPEKPEYSEMMKKGIRYSLNHETELRRFLEDGHIPCDNGFAERHIRPFATSRKTWMFCNTIDGAKAIAILYTLVETARANNVDVYYYLKYLLDNMPKYMEGKDRSFLADMMPWSQAVKDYIEEQKRSMIEQFNLNPDKDPPNKKKSQPDSSENESA